MWDSHVETLYPAGANAGEQVFQNLVLVGRDREQGIVSCQITSLKCSHVDLGGETVTERVTNESKLKGRSKKWHKKK
jgi:hypothetical protein